ncbi:Putative fructokinase [Paenibacillus allorhizoplanae]|uniref:fructokinase n=1 Tax=Paenibacillus allorhizoplanae TaxID=2905648 RepID=A0ABM9CS76_9BACL|nr:ROK family protein [Paenibacillus allorhizoplanae]CAH1222930.1 Putative fructokinase [Paenibacillus allorhizoplanae]
MRYGAIEAGGTKFVCGIGNEEGIIEDRISFPTEHPEQTMQKVIDYFADKNVTAIGIGSFGPINVDPSSPLYGYITTTPKPGWANYDVLGKLRESFNVPFGWDTDVNAAAFGEAKWGAAQGLDSCVYYTVGTGIGVGVYMEGRLVHGLVHPEGGHVMIRPASDDSFQGTCPYHGDCLEGMAAGPAIEQRWGVKGSELPVDHPTWDLEAYYLAQSISSTILMMSPKKIILGGGVMQQAHLFPLIHTHVQKILNGYIRTESLLENIHSYIVPPGLGTNSGLRGSLALGVEAKRNQQ